MFHTQRASSQSQVQHSHAEPHLGTGQVRQLQSVVCPARRQRDALRGVRKRHATGLSRHARFGLSFQKVGDLGYYAGSSMNKGSIPGGHRKTQSMHPRYKTESLMAGPVPGGIVRGQPDDHRHGLVCLCNSYSAWICQFVCSSLAESAGGIQDTGARASPCP